MNNLKSAHPAPPPIRGEKRIKLIDYPWFTTRYLAQIIVHQYPELSERSQQRLVQISIQELRLHNFESYPITGYFSEDLKPRLPHGTPEYSRKAAQLILENMRYEVELL
jgi:hypothetical protein